MAEPCFIVGYVLRAFYLVLVLQLDHFLSHLYHILPPTSKAVANSQL